MKKVVPCAVALALVAGCAPTGVPASRHHSPQPSPAPTPSLGPTNVPDYLLNPDVAKDGFPYKNTICMSGWTKTIRPPLSYTEALKRSQLPPGAKLSDYEEDHWIPLELGGAPREPRNLWPQPWPDAHKKDLQENTLNKAVCSGQMSLDAARLQMYRWRVSG